MKIHFLSDHSVVAAVWYSGIQIRYLIIKQIFPQTVCSFHVWSETNWVNVAETRSTDSYTVTVYSNYETSTFLNGAATYDYFHD